MRRLIFIFLVCLVFCPVKSFAAMPEFVWAGGGIMVSDQSSPGYMADTMISFGSYNSIVFFADPMLTLRHEKLGVSLGGGGRFAMFSGEIIGGLNGYFDYNNDHNHRRFAVGAEAFQKFGSAYFNVYLPTSGLNDGQEALPGFDFNICIPIPNFALITVWPGMFFYSGKHENDLIGVSIKVKAQPIKPLEVYLGFRSEAPESGRNTGEIFAGIDIAIPITGFDIEKLIKFYNPQYPLEINSQMGSRVVRERFISYENYHAE